ncbi:MAG: Mov34/MPN/PAD-1 family protein [Planctomycetota bacterium]|nr:Mov34/MPN/PAD-1 family protein [Planctomycetota bacterium]
MSGQVDYRRIEKKEASDGKFPVEVESEYRVFINEKAYQTMKTHAGTTNEVEICGVLIGEVKRDAQGAFLVINGTIEGKNANNHGAQVTFTHQTWEYINSIKDKEYANQRIVGWYHTHPGFGVFLSKMDMFIQENFFHHPFQVAIVIETKKHEEGCFVWREGKSVPIRRYWVGKEEVKLVNGEVEEISMADMRRPAAAAAAAAAPPPRLPDDDLRAGGFTYLHLLIMILVFFCGFLLGKMLILQDVQRIVGDPLEEELYSIIELGSMNLLAKDDMTEIKNRVAAAEEQLKKNDAAGAAKTLGQTKADIEALLSTYGKRRSEIRGDYSQASQVRRNMSNRILSQEQAQQQMEVLVGGLYLQRLSEVLLRNGRPVDLRTTPPEYRDTVKYMMEQLIKMRPQAKDAIRQMHPTVFEDLYGPATEAKTDEKSAEPAKPGAATDAKK